MFFPSKPVRWCIVAALHVFHKICCLSRCLNVPVTGHSFEDALLMTKAAELGLPPDTGVIEFCNTAGKLGYATREQLRIQPVYIIILFHTSQHECPVESKLGQRGLM